MSLEAGHKLAHYEILEPIGKGGMGEVYRAKDSKLGRDVAIKVLPDEFAENEERLARFKREAKVLASLNHPGIAAIHGLEESEGTHYLVLELVPGETLAERISRGPIPVEEALEIATKIAEALEEAHEQGIVHRDLKPANIKQTEDGKIKVLDFGLAKVFQAETPDADSSMSPTLTRDATRVGVILGTAAYMSPEQAKAKKVDKRTDIFAFGAVLFEMLTAKKAFAGEDVSEVLAAVIKSEPDWDVLPRNLPGRSRELLRRCLAKELRQRTPDIAVARQEIALAGSPDSTMEANANPWWRPLPWLAVALMGSVTVWALWMLMRFEAPPRSVIRFTMSAGLLSHVHRGLAVAPDGTHVVYSPGGDAFHLRPMAELDAIPVRGFGIPADPMFSPDSEWLAAFDYGDGLLKKTAIAGGPAITLCQTSAPFGGSWASDDYLLVGQGPEGILRVAASGGSCEVVVAVGAGEAAANPVLLPDGETVLFTLATGGAWDEAQIVSESLVTGERRVVLSGASDARYLPTGHLVYAQEQKLLVVPFDVTRVAVVGNPVLVAEDVLVAARSGALHYDVSASGSLVYAPRREGSRRLAWVDRRGNEELLPLEPRPYYVLRISPDGQSVAVDVQDSVNRDVWIYEFSRHSSTRFTFAPGQDSYPVWTPDGSGLFTGSERDGGERNLFWRAADGTGDEERLTTFPRFQVPMDVTRDGKHVLFIQLGASGTEIGVLSLEEGREVKTLVAEAGGGGARFSPDGAWIAYDSDAPGESAVIVRPFPDVDSGRWQIAQRGRWPVWAPDGRELYYWTREGLMSVAIETEPSFRHGTPQLLFNDPGIHRSNGSTYDVAPDGERFLIVKSWVADDASAEIVVVLNWFEELERLVPTGN